MIAIGQTSGDFQHEAWVAIHIGAGAELANENDFPPFRIEKQDRGSDSVIMHLAMDAERAPVTSLLFKNHRLQMDEVLPNRLLFNELDARLVIDLRYWTSSGPHHETPIRLSSATPCYRGTPRRHREQQHRLPSRR